MHQAIVAVIETSFKMASTLGKKFKNFVWFGPYDFVQITPACGPNTKQIMHGETLNFQCQHQQ